MGKTFLQQPNTKAQDISQSIKKKESVKIRLDYLDGLRGLAALYVVIYHTQLAVTARGGDCGLPSVIFHLTRILDQGRYSVAIFIVLSGYCLMLPVVRSVNGTLRGGTASFFLRRARRILPPYYAAVILSLSIMAFYPHPTDPTRSITSIWDHALPINAINILLHILLLHNLSHYYIFRLNSAMWSVATEWQIYFLFPFLLLPIWRKFSIWALIMSGLIIGVGIHYISHSYYDGAAPWFIGLFAMGMAGAVINFTNNPRLIRTYRYIHWGWISLSGALGFFFINILFRHEVDFLNKYLWMMDVCVGIAASSLIIYCTRYLTDFSDRPHPWFLKAFESRQAIWLGVFSYSLYLMHMPVLAALQILLLRLHFTPLETLITMILVGTPASLGICYIFHLFFEKPFLPQHYKEQEEKQSSR